jgi:serine/threonine-protein kinase HipA
MESIIAEVIDATPSVIDRVAASLPATFPGKLFDTIAAGLRKAAAQLEAMPPK